MGVADDKAPGDLGLYERRSFPGARRVNEIVSTKRTTLFRMSDGTTLRSALVAERRESSHDFSVEDVTVDGAPALLVSGAVSRKSSWANDVALLTGQKIELHSQVPGAALLIELEGTIWAITWGQGFHFLDGERIDFGFGPRVVARSADAGEIKSLTKTILDHRARVDRSSLPNGSSIRDLGVDGYGEAVSRIEAKARIPELSFGDKQLALRAADSLNLPLAKKADALLRDLEVIAQVLERPVKQGLESLEQLVALKSRDPQVSVLDAALVAALKSDEEGRLGISWPHERLDAHAPMVSVKITGFGDRSSVVLDDVPPIEMIKSWVAALDDEAVLDRLKAIRIELHSDAVPASGTLASAPVALRRWLAFEIEEEGKRYCLHDGGWYAMDDRYLDRIDERVREILATTATVELPAWPTDEEEKHYNIRAAAVLSGISLDRKLISTPLHSRGGIEPCDIFSAPGTLIHVKRGRSSADLSHLLAQALVSTDSLARDENARAAWRDRVIQESDGSVPMAEIREVVVAIGTDKPVDADRLFTFTKVNLVKQHDALKYLDVNVAVVGVPSE